MAALGAGNLLPRIVTTPPGPRARALARRLDRWEAPGVNTVADGVPALAWQAARGANVLDVDGNRYVDLTSGFGVAAVGHRHPAVTAAVRRQSGTLVHGLGDVHGHPARVDLAARLARLAPVDDARVYFAISGADAVEVAVKTALLATGRPGIVAFDPAYHGLTLGALAATSRAAFRAPFAEHLHAHVHRLPFGCEPERLAELLTGRDDVGCLLVEPIVGREGVLLPPDGWLGAVARLCRRRGVVFAADEIFTGFGRCGTTFAVEREGVRPDLLCCGKALGGGWPLAAAIGRRELMAAWEAPGEARHAATFLAHPVACAAALATLDVLRREKLAARAARLEKLVRARLAPLAAGHPAVIAVRGRGLLWGIELASAATARGVADGAMRAGVLVLAGGADGRVLQLVPPLTIAERQLDDALTRLRGVLEATASGAPVPGSGWG